MCTQGSARLQESNFFIYVKTLYAETLTINIDMQATIDGVKNAIEHIKGIPPGQQILIYARKRLDDSRTLVHYSIGNGSILFLILRQSGC
ncbi:Nmr based structural model of the Ubch8-ubiquitin complex [Hyaloscypha hepaticicola]|uniref:Nmr based structural model of the Ubch8-ubiquitin complex n=1 Tax=Hyaloscypha hepaticicola TaxID=2082293 RepID=A0A2J6PW02_9HELO|nr:Nmr based structural model of the Ubch8-ubiquitin complex [Hyaloscypha hepaticicola]